MTAASLRLGRLAPGLPRALGPIAFAVLAALLFVLFRGQLTLPHDNDAQLFTTIKEIRVFVEDNRNAIPLLAVIRSGVGSLVVLFQEILHALSWPGLTAIAAAIGLLIGGWRYAALGAGAFIAFGALGLWEASIDTLALTLASVMLALAIGIPLGILAGKSERFYRAITPVLDLMQIMPTFAYLAPFALFFLIGPATAAILTLIYAAPPAIRITALGIRGVSPTTVEAATSLGATGRQVLGKVELPMARRVIILGINQTFMMDLSIVVITVLVDAPGLGKNILRALERADVGAGFDAGLAIVVMAILFDRFTSRASEGADPQRAAMSDAGAARARRHRAIALALAVGGVVVGAVLLANPDFPEAIGISFRGVVNEVTGWLRTNAVGVTGGIKDLVSYGLINPIQAVLTSAPWPLVVGVAVGVALWVSGTGPAIVTAVCLFGIIGLQLWEHSMETLTTVFVAAVLTLGLGLAIGILSARSNRLSLVLRPFLDAAQTMPAFVYLIPAVALFEPTRFTAIVAAVIFAMPPVIRLVEAGIRTVPATVVEAATAAGTTPRQLLWKVQLPMARPALLLAANQGIILVLAMVVVGGLVGAGALGYDVVAGFARRDFFGEGFAAGIAIVLLGVMLDRITQGAGRRRTGRLETVEDVVNARPGSIPAGVGV
jgi:glycine betaine/proline transport system permease protein